jgi:hypothetical protein
MKTTLIIAIATIALLTSCAEKEDVAPNDENIKTRIYACFDEKTRTVLNANGSVYWSEGDKIFVNGHTSLEAKDMESDKTIDGKTIV